LLPAISALAAGNTVIIKPSELPNQTSKAIAKIINANFDPKYIHVVEGGVDTTQALLAEKYDKIFFTGSIPVGKIIYEAAAKHLTPVTLELGGKSPTFVFADADIKMTAQRIVWAKFFNAGQTCVAPDYILVEKSIEESLLTAMRAEIEKRYSDLTEIGNNYTQIINSKNYERLASLIDKTKVYCGGHTNIEKLLIEPTILKHVNFEDEIMEDEIFGPILPVINFTNIEDAVSAVKSKPKPLSCYIYSKNKKVINKLLHEISFGGGAINDSMMHLSNMNLPFGGVGSSGIGNYHGKYGFDCFSHQKSILHKSFIFELEVKYAPYTNFKLKLVKWLMG
jgi:aldehyde dehydrogenase (NAD+)